MEPKEFSRTYAVKWADLDTNGHLRYSVYLDFAVDTQFRSLKEYGYTQERFVEKGIGPVSLRMEARYQHEVTIDDSVVDSLRIAGISPDGARWKSWHDIVKSNGDMAATIKLEGVWIDLHTRQAVAPPSDLLEILNLIPRTEDFETLRSFIRGKK